MSNAATVAAGQPNLTPQNALIEIILFMPGVTASLATFLVFGTAKSWRQYRDLYAGGCGVRNKIIQRRFIRQRESSNIVPQDRDANGGEGGAEDLEFAPLPRLQNTYSEEERKTQEEARKRVRMFTREVGEERSVFTTTITAASDDKAKVVPPKLSPGWDGRSLEASTVADITIRSDHEYSMKPLAPRPIQQQQQQRFQDKKSLHFHKPRPSVSSSRLRPNQGSFGGSAIIEVGMASENGATIEREPGNEEGNKMNRPGWTRMDSTYR